MVSKGNFLELGIPLKPIVEQLALGAPAHRRKGISMRAHLSPYDWCQFTKRAARPLHTQ